MFKKLTPFTLTALLAAGTVQQVQGMQEQTQGLRNNLVTLVDATKTLSPVLFVVGGVVYLSKIIDNPLSKYIPSTLTNSVLTDVAIRAGVGATLLALLCKAGITIIDNIDDPRYHGFWQKIYTYITPYNAFHKALRLNNPDFVKGVLGQLSQAKRDELLQVHEVLAPNTNNLATLQVLLTYGINPNHLHPTFTTTPPHPLLVESQFWAQPNCVSAPDVREHCQTLLAQKDLLKCLYNNKYTNDSIARAKKRVETQDNLLAFAKNGIKSNVTFTEIE